ncbi:MAG: MDR family MFS transporter [Sporolactobacillus sp.]
MSDTKIMTEIKRGPITATLIIGAFVAILNETFLNIALSGLIQYFHVPATTVQWLTTAYLLVIGILMPITALITGWFTTRQMFLGAMGLFLAGTILCGFSPSFSFLLIGRIIQAIGAGLLMPVMMNTILLIYPPEKRGAAMGLIGLVIMFAPALGPTLSGLILSALSWRWLFYLIIPLAIFAIIIGTHYLQNVSELTKPKVEIRSILLSSIGFGGIVYGMGSGVTGGWISLLILVIGVLSLIGFVWLQLVLKQPILNLRAFRYRMFALSTILLILVMMVLFSTMILLPLYLQRVLLLSSFGAGMLLLPGGLINGLLSPVMGKLFDKWGSVWLVTPGLILVTAVIGLFAGLTPSANVVYVAALYTVMMVGLAMVMMPVTTTGLNQLPKALYPHGTAIMNTLQQVSGGIGTAVFIGIMAGGQKAYLQQETSPNTKAAQMLALTHGMSIAFLCALILTVVALLLSLLLRKKAAPEEAGEERTGS